MFSLPNPKVSLNGLFIVQSSPKPKQLFFSVIDGREKKQISTFKKMGFSKKQMFDIFLL